MARAPALQAGGQGFDSLALHKKRDHERWSLFLWRAREENAQHFLFLPPSKPSPRGKAWSLRAEAPKGACGSGGVLLFGRRGALGHVLGAFQFAAAGWRLADG